MVLEKQFDMSFTLIVVKARKLQLIFSFSATCNVSKVHFFKTWITWDWLEITRRFFRHYFFLIFLHQTHLFWKKNFRKFSKIMKIAFFVSIRENRQIYEGAISLIYQPILINLDIKLIVLMRGIQWNKLQSNISINKNFRFLPLLCELCSKKVKKRKNWPSESKKKLHHDFFQIFSHINSSDRTLHLTTTRPSGQRLCV